MLTLLTCSKHFSFCKLPAKAPIPSWIQTISSDYFLTVTRTHDELSIIGDRELLLEKIPDQVDDGNDWRIFKIEGILDFGLVGILKKAVDPLAESGISIVAISTFNTDYFFVKEPYYLRAKESLVPSFHIKEEVETKSEKINNDIIYRCEKATKKSELLGWQFAVNGKWDEAMRISFDQSPEQRVDQIQHWFQKQVSPDVAFELLFELENKERFFFGVRMTHLEPEEKISVMSQILTMSRKGASLSEAVNGVRKVLGDENIAATAPEYLELGVFDLWNRVGSLVVWKKGEKLGEKTAMISPSEIATKTKKPDMGFSPLHEPQTKPLMLEAAWKRDVKNKQNFQCWISLPVTKYDIKTNKYTLSEEQYHSAATTFIDESAY